MTIELTMLAYALAKSGLTARKPKRLTVATPAVPLVYQTRVSSL